MNKQYEFQEEPEDNTIKIILDSSEWTQWPILMLKRRDQIGYLFEGKGSVVNVLDVVGAVVSKIKYIDFNAMIDDGWEIN